MAKGDCELLVDLTNSLNCMTLDSPPKINSDIEKGPSLVETDEEDKSVQNDGKEKMMQNGDKEAPVQNKSVTHENLSGVPSELSKAVLSSAKVASTVNDQQQEPLKKNSGIDKTTSSSTKVRMFGETRLFHKYVLLLVRGFCLGTLTYGAGLLSGLTGHLSRKKWTFQQQKSGCFSET